MQIESIRLLFEDDDLLALSKPAGMHSERRRNDSAPSVAGYLAANFPAEWRDRIDWSGAGLLQRLDQSTSGVILAAKSEQAFFESKARLSRPETKKQYLAFVDGAPPERFEVSCWIGSPYRRGKKVRCYPSARARAQHGETGFSRLVQSEPLLLSLVRAELTSGRRHQVRAQSSHAGYPLTGDALYGSTRRIADIFPDWDSEAVPFFLHAARIEIPAEDGMALVLEAPLPGYAADVVSTLGRDAEDLFRP